MFQQTQIPYLTKVQREKRIKNILSLMKGDLRFRKAVELAEIKDNDNILDLGYGDGWLKDYLPKNINYLSIDINGKADINYNLNNGLPKLNKRFNVIFLLEILEYIQNYKRLLLDCKNHLKKEGRIIITTPTNNCFIRLSNSTHCFRKAHLINLAKELKMNYFITGVHLRIPYLNIFIPSKQMIYNDCFLGVLR